MTAALFVLAAVGAKAFYLLLIWLASAIAASEKAGQNALQFVPFDLEDIEGIPRLVAGLRKRTGPIYGLVNNAAMGEGGALSLMHNARIDAWCASIRSPRWC